MAKKLDDILVSHINVTDMRQGHLCDVFKVTKKTIQNWMKDGCPRKENGNYDLRDVIKWREAKLKLPSGDDSKRNEEILKLQNQNKKYELEIAEMEGKTITKDKYEEILTKMASELMLFLKGGYKRNGLELWNEIRKCKTLNEFLEVMDGFIKQAMDAFAGGGEDM